MTHTKFAWVRIADWAGYNPVHPVILHGDRVGPKLDLVGDMHLMKPHEQSMTIAELSTIYPAPEQGEHDV